MQIYRNNNACSKFCPRTWFAPRFWEQHNKEQWKLGKSCSTLFIAQRKIYKQFNGLNVLALCQVDKGYWLLYGQKHPYQINNLIPRDTAQPYQLEENVRCRTVYTNNVGAFLSYQYYMIYVYLNNIC